MPDVLRILHRWRLTHLCCVHLLAILVQLDVIGCQCHQRVEAHAIGPAVLTAIVLQAEDAQSGDIVVVVRRWHGVLHHNVGCPSNGMGLHCCSSREMEHRSCETPTSVVNTYT